MAPILPSGEAPVDYTALTIKPFKGYELSFGSSLAKVGRLGADKSCVKQTNSQTDRHYYDSYIDKVLFILMFCCY